MSLPGRVFVRARVNDLLWSSSGCEGVVLKGTTVRAPVVVAGSSDLRFVTVRSQRLDSMLQRSSFKRSPVTKPFFNS